MKNQLIATLVAGIIIFIWQFLSWAALNLHGAEQQYTDKQEAILQCLSENLQPGHYFLPNTAPGEDTQAYIEKYGGKPWAMISYHPAMNTNMGLNMFRGLVVDFVAAFLLIWLLMNFKHLTFNTALLASLSVGTIAYLTLPYLNSIWYENPTLSYLLDTAVQWGLVGAWLGWWMPKRMV